MTDKVSDKTNRYKVKSPGRGGARRNAGRPKGSSTKVSGEELLKDFRKASGGITFSQFIVRKMIELHNIGDNKSLINLVNNFSKYMIDNIEHVDVTSNGDQVAVNLIINSKVAPGWEND